MNYADSLKIRLKLYKKEDIIFTEHASIQAEFRGIDIKEVRENVINPERLVYAIKQEAEKEGEEKYDCYFGYSNTYCQRYILAVNHKCIVCTVIKINRRWQFIAEKYAKI